MKTKSLLKSLLVTCCCIIAGSASAQNYYKLNVQNSSYDELTQASVLNSTDSIAEAYYVATNLLFPVFGYTIDFNQKSTVPSLGAYITRDGYLAVYESPSYAYTMVFHAAYNNYRRRDNTSSISVSVSGTAGKEILKIQWKNMGIVGKPDSNYVNFQVWFNAKDNSISYHYGPSVITGDVMPVIGLFRSPNNFSALTHSSYVFGHPTTPSTLSLVQPAGFNEITAVSEFPPSGTVYYFDIKPVGLEQPGAQQQLFAAWPNPVTTGLLHTNIEDNYKIYDMSGKLALEQEGTSIDVSSLTNGIYILRNSVGNTHRFAVQ